MQAVLSVDYSDSGLNVNLFADDEGVADVLRQVYDQQLGADRREQPGHLQAVKDLLTEVAKAPLGHDLYGHPMPDKIQRVVLYGDTVMDGGFLDILKAVVGEDVVNNAHSFEPVFAAAVGMATSSFESMNWLDFNVEPAFGCRWRSRLYDAPSEEL
ncbi:hypothetical protein K4K48_002068 [Colletotrichum sp. SAR 10_66]|nr:hypothetical protein K4K48_002068 [Colletotrichum sp. SAR 10_66]